MAQKKIMKLTKQGTPRKREPRPNEGHPDFYKPEYAELAKNQTLNLTGFAVLVGVGKTTVSRWIEKYPEFRASTEIMLAKYEWDLERGAKERVPIGPNGTVTERYNPRFAQFLYGVRLGLYEKTEVKNELVGKDGAELQAPVFNIAFSNASKT